MATHPPAPLHAHKPIPALVAPAKERVPYFATDGKPRISAEELKAEAARAKAMFASREGR